MRSLLLALLTGLVGALALHIVVILAIPFFATNDAWSRVAALDANDRFVRTESLPGEAVPHAGDEEEMTAPDGLAFGAPFVKTAICRYDVGASPVHLSASGHTPFWALAVFDRQSNELFSMNDRTASGPDPDVTLASRIQMVGLRESVPPELAQSILVELPVTEGYVLLRTVMPDDSWDAETDAFLASAACRTVAAR